MVLTGGGGKAPMIEKAVFTCVAEVATSLNCSIDTSKSVEREASVDTISVTTQTNWGN